MSREIHITSVEVWLPGVDVPFDCTDVYYTPAVPARGFDPGESSEVRLEGPIRLWDDDFDELLSEKAKKMVMAALKEKLDNESYGPVGSPAFSAPTSEEL